MAPGTQALCEEETEVAPCYFIAAGITRVFGDVAAAWCGGFGEVFVFAVATGPFIIPDVEDSTSLGRRLGFHG